VNDVINRRKTLSKAELDQCVEILLRFDEVRVLGEALRQNAFEVVIQEYLKHTSLSPIQIYISFCRGKQRIMYHRLVPNYKEIIEQSPEPFIETAIRFGDENMFYDAIHCVPKRPDHHAIGFRALEYAIFSGQTPIVLFFARNQIRDHFDLDLNDESTKKMINRGLSLSALCGRFDIVRGLVQYFNADVNYRNGEVLANSARFGHVAKYLAERGAIVSPVHLYLMSVARQYDAYDYCCGKASWQPYAQRKELGEAVAEFLRKRDLMMMRGKGPVSERGSAHPSSASSSRGQ
jgi:hypothetical protein